MRKGSGPGYRFLTGLCVLLGCICVIDQRVAAQHTKALEVIDSMFDAEKKRASGISNYTLTFDVYMNGGGNALGSATEYREKVSTNGFPTFVAPQRSRDSGKNFVTGGYEMYQRLKAAAIHEGMDEVDGYLTHVLYVADPSAWIDDFKRFGPKGTQSLISLRFYVDVNELVLRKVQMRGRVVNRLGQVSRLDASIKLGDYREVSGLLYPFLVTTTMDGLTGAFTQEEREKAQQGIQDLRAKLEAAEEHEQAELKRQFTSLVEQYDNLISRDRMEMSIVVMNLDVNTGAVRE